MAISAGLFGFLYALGLVEAAAPSPTLCWVSSIGSDTAGTGEEEKPWATVTKALESHSSRRDYEWLQIQIEGSIDDSVVLPSFTRLVGMGPGPGTGTRAALRGVAGKPAIHIFRTDPPFPIEHVEVTGLKVSGGTRSGIRIADAVDVTVSDCEITGNSGTRGGGVYIRGSRRVTVSRCQISDNAAGTPQSALPDAAFRPVLDLDAATGAARKWAKVQRLEYEPGDAHGGGIYLEDSDDVTIERNLIAGNRAVLFGGGIAVDNSEAFHTAAVTIDDNEIVCNQTAHGDLDALNLPTTDCPAAMEDAVYERFYVLATNLALKYRAEAADGATGLLHGYGLETGMGGGIALRMVSERTVVRGNRIGMRKNGDKRPNRARRGGGISCFTGAYPKIVGNEIAYNGSSGDGGGIAMDFFDPFMPDGDPPFLNYFRAGRMIAREPVRLIDNRVHHNASGEDGGGLYATGGALVEITATKPVGPDGTSSFEANRAAENGGGIRVSYATRLNVADTLVRANEANVIKHSDPKRDKEAGGAIAARNACVRLERCDFRENEVHRFAGGAIYFNSTYEGGFDEYGFLDYGSGQFDRLQITAFGLQIRTYEVIDCTGEANKAANTSGAGGFLYAVRNKALGGSEPMWVSVRGPSTKVGVNRSEYLDEKDHKQKRGNIVVELSGKHVASGAAVGALADRFYIDDQVPSDAIAESAPDEPPSTDHGVVVLSDGDDKPPDPRGATTRRPYFSETVTGPDGVPAPLITGAERRFVDRRYGGWVRLVGGVFVPWDLAGREVHAEVDGRPTDLAELRAESFAVWAPPAQATGPVDVKLFTPWAPPAVGALAIVYVNRPTISAVTPSHGPRAGHTSLTIDGTGFWDGLEVLLRVGFTEDIWLPLTDVHIVSGTRLTARTPPAPLGVTAADVVVRFDPVLSALAAGAFVYELA